MVRARFALGGLGFSLLALVGCGGQADLADASPAGVVTAALSTQESVLGFEDAQGWTASGGALATTSIHSQGSAALSVTTNGYTELTSVGLSTLSSPNAT